MNAMKPTPSRLSAVTKEEQARDKMTAMLDYKAEKLAVEAKTAKLRAARLAREAADRLAKETAGPSTSVEKQKVKGRTVSAGKRTVSAGKR